MVTISPISAFHQKYNHRYIFSTSPLMRKNDRRNSVGTLRQKLNLIDQWTNWPMVPWTNSPMAVMDQCTNEPTAPARSPQLAPLSPFSLSLPYPWSKDNLSLSSPWLPFILILFILFIIILIILYLVLITFHYHHLAAFSQVDDFGCSTIDCVFSLLSYFIFHCILFLWLNIFNVLWWGPLICSNFLCPFVHWLYNVLLYIDCIMCS